MKEEWLMPGAIVPVNPDTTKALVDEIKRLIGVIGGMALQQAEKQEPVKMVAYNCLCGRIMKFESVNGIVAPQREWVGLTDEEIESLWDHGMYIHCSGITALRAITRAIEAKLKEKNT
jgi:hypothetical protein